MKTKTGQILVLTIIAVVFLANANISLAMYDAHLGRFTSRDPAEGDFKEPLTLRRISPNFFIGKAEF